MPVTTVVDGVASGGATVLAAKKVAPRQRTLVYEHKDTWPARMPTAWQLQATVSAKGDDLYANTLVWK